MRSSLAALAPARFVQAPAPFDAVAAAGQLRAASRDLAAMGMPSEVSLLVGLVEERHRGAVLAALERASGEVDAAMGRRYVVEGGGVGWGGVASQG